MGKAIVGKGVFMGGAIFIVGEIVTSGYGRLCMTLFQGKEYSPLSAMMSKLLIMFQWIFHFMSKIFLICGGKDIIGSLPISPILVLRGIDLIFWIVLSVVVLHVMDRKQKTN